MKQTNYSHTTLNYIFDTHLTYGFKIMTEKHVTHSHCVSATFGS